MPTNTGRNEAPYIKFRIDKCPILDPRGKSYIGTEVTGAALAKIVHAVRQKQIARQNQFAMTPDEINALYTQASLWNEYTPLQLYLKCADLGLYNWLDSSMYPYYTALFAIIVCASAASPLYQFIFPKAECVVETHSPTWKERDRDWGNVKQNWKKWNKWANQVDAEEEVKHSAYSYFNTHTKFETHSGNSYLQCINTTISDTMCYFGARADDDKGNKIVESTCHGIHVKDRWVMTCSHWYLEYATRPNVSVNFHNKGKYYKFDMPTGKDVIRVAGVDIVFFRVPKQVQQPPSALPYFVDMQHLFSIPDGTSLTMLHLHPVTKAPALRHMMKAAYTAEISYTSHNEMFILDQAISYFETTTQGESGSMLIAEGPQGKVCLLGMHIGCAREVGKKDVSVAIPICRENIELMLEPDVIVETHADTNHAPAQVDNMRFASRECPWFEKYVAPTHAEPMLVEGEEFPLPVLFHVDQHLAHHPPSASKICASKVFGWDGPPECVPAMLNPTYVKDTNTKYFPLHLALRKVTTEHYPAFQYPPRVMAHMQATYPRDLDHVGRVLTMQEACDGVSERGIPGIHLSTSSGYDFKVRTGHGRGKAPYLTRNTHGTVDILDSFATEVNTKLAGLEKGDRFQVLWADSLKDETRPVEKVKVGKTRVISSCPLDYLVITRMYFADLMAYIQRTPATKPVSVGINPHGLSWATLYSRLSKHKGSVLSGDFTNFDSKMPRFVMEFVVDYINWWYDDGEVNAQIRRTLLMDITDAMHIVFTSVYLAHGGVPSGHPWTSTGNSLGLDSMIYYILTECFGMDEGEFEVALYGDDNVITTDKVGLRCSDLAPHFLRLFGMTYTHYSKKESETYDTLETITYLGRSFVGGLRAPLSIKTIVECTYWARSEDSDNFILLSTIDSFIMELSHHDVATYEKYTKKLGEVVHKTIPKIYQVYLSKVKSWYHYQDLKYNEGKAYRNPHPYSNTKQIDLSRKKTREISISDFSLQYSDFQCHSGTGSAAPVSDDRHTEFTQRASNEAPPTVPGELGDYHDVAPVQQSAVDGTIIADPHKSWNMETFTLDNIFNRTYPAPKIVWTPSQIAGVVLATYELPDFLFGQEFNVAKLMDYRYFRGGFRITIRIISNQFNYGKIIAFYSPRVADESFPVTDIYRASGYPHVLASASAGDTVVLDVPFISPYRALDIVNYTPGELGQIQIRVLNELTSVTTEIANAEVFVTFGFINSEVMFPHALESPTVGALYTYKKGVGYTKVDGSFDVHSGKVTKYARKGMDTAEQHAKSVSATVGSRMENMAPGVGTITAPSQAQTYLDTFTTYAAPAAAFLGLLGLSKPTTTNVGSITKVNPFTDLVYGKGLDTGPKLAMDPENGITTQPVVGGIGVDEMELLRLIGTPMMISQNSFLEATTAQVLCVCGPFDGQAICYVDWVTRLFDYRRGSYKFKFYITASLFHSVRMVFWFSDNVDTAPNWQACLHKVVDIQGDTELSFTLPYIEREAAKAVGNGTAFGIWAQVLSWSQPDNTLTCPITINVYKSAASDFRLAGYREYTFTPTCNPRADFAVEFPPFTDDMTAYKCEGLLFGEEYTTVREIVHRYQPQAVTSGNFQTWRPATHGTICMGMTLWGLLYRFHRGSLRFKLLSRDYRYIECAYLSTLTGSYPGAYLSCPTNPLLEFEVPYYSSMLFESTDVSSTKNILTSTTAPKYLLDAAGDDFSFHFIRPPPVGALSLPDTSHGTIGLANWLSGATPTTVLIGNQPIQVHDV